MNSKIESCFNFNKLLLEKSVFVSLSSEIVILYSLEPWSLGGSKEFFGEIEI